MNIIRVPFLLRGLQKQKVQKGTNCWGTEFLRDAYLEVHGFRV